MAASRDLISLLASDSTVAALDRHYKRAVERILEELARGVTRPGGARAAETLANVKALVRDLDPSKASYVRDWIRRNIPKAYVLGDRAATQELRAELRAVASDKADEFGKVNTTFSGVNQVSMKAVTAAMESNMTGAAGEILKNAGLFIRRTQLIQTQDVGTREAVTSGIIRGATHREVADDIASILRGGKITPEMRTELREAGFGGVYLETAEAFGNGQLITVGQRRFSVQGYANLVARTQMREAHKVGTIVRLQQNEVDHVRVSRHRQDDPDECTPWAGQVFYIGPGVDPLGFPPISTILNGGPPFHPNCKHVLTPYVVEFKNPKSIDEANEEAAGIPRRFFGKGPGEIRDMVSGMSDDELEEAFPQGFEDIREEAA